MLECISAMREKSVSLVRGVDNLLFLRDALDTVEEGWANEFTSNLATLESAGLASPEQIASMGSRYSDIVMHALDALERMVRGRFPLSMPPEEEGNGDIE